MPKTIQVVLAMSPEIDIVWATLVGFCFWLFLEAEIKVIILYLK